jgi:hypothetical protein
MVFTRSPLTRRTLVATITVLSPRPKVDTTDDDPGPGLSSLRGAVVGLRTDYIWAEWDVVSSTWAEMLRAEGADVRFWRAGHRSGPEGEETEKGLRQFIDDVDLAVVGLGN